MSAVAKPHVNAKSIPWLLRIWERVVASEFYLASDQNLGNAPSDTLDGWAYPKDVADLVRRRILYVQKIPANERISNAMPVSWGFTERGIAIMRAWVADRPIVAPDTRPSPNCCPNCGAPLDEHA